MVHCRSALEWRGHCFVRYADDCNVYVGSQRAGERMMALLKRLYGRLKLRINEAKSPVVMCARPDAVPVQRGHTGSESGAVLLIGDGP